MNRGEKAGHRYFKDFVQIISYTLGMFAFVVIIVVVVVVVVVDVVVVVTTRRGVLRFYRFFLAESKFVHNLNFDFFLFEHLPPFLIVDFCF